VGIGNLGETKFSFGLLIAHYKQALARPDALSAQWPDTDDVVDIFFSMYTSRNVTDKVGPHGVLFDEFPYLGPPHDWRPRDVSDKPNANESSS
jgi:hypothetical protein